MFKMIMGSQHNKASTDTRSRVFVKRLFREAPFRCCESTLSCWKFLQMAMLQTHMATVRPNRTGTEAYKLDSNELKKCNKVINEDTKTANVQSKKMMTRYVLVDNERCLKGQNTAWNLSQEIKAADIYEPNETCVKYLIGAVFKVIFRSPKLIVSPDKENVKGQSEGS